MRMERLALIKERHGRLVLRQRQEVGTEVVDDADDEDYVPELASGEIEPYGDEDE
jgi:hypothetical protein